MASPVRSGGAALELPSHVGFGSEDHGWEAAPTKNNRKGGPLQLQLPVPAQRRKQKLSVFLPKNKNM
jgi:hypothetical protein